MSRNEVPAAGLRLRQRALTGVIALGVAATIAVAAMAIGQRAATRARAGDEVGGAVGGAADEARSWLAVELGLRRAAMAAMQRGEPAQAQQLIERAMAVGARQYVQKPAAAAALALAAGHTLLAELALADARGGGLERGQEQLQRALQLLEPWQVASGEEDVPMAPAVVRAMAQTLAALGDLDARRQRRGGARDQYDRAVALAAALPTDGDEQLPRQRLLVELTLRRLEQRIDDDSQCESLVRLQGPLLLLAERDARGRGARSAEGGQQARGDDDWRSFERMLEVCPRLGAGDGGEGGEGALADLLEAERPERRAPLGRMRLALARGLFFEENWAAAVEQLERGARLLEAALLREAREARDTGSESDDGATKRATTDETHEAAARRALLALYALRLAVPGASSADAAVLAARCWRAATGAPWQAQRVECALASLGNVRGAERIAAMHRLIAELATTEARDDGSAELRSRHLRHLVGAGLSLADAGRGAPSCALAAALGQRAEALLRSTEEEWASRAASPAPLILDELTEQVEEGRRQLAGSLRRRADCR